MSRAAAEHRSESLGSPAAYRTAWNDVVGRAAVDAERANGMIARPHAMPATPPPLSLLAAIVPATCVP